jgi:kynureninase
VESQLRFHGYDPATSLIEVGPREPDGIVTDDDVQAAIEAHGERIALVLLPGVQYLTGHAFDMGAITREAAGRGCRVGWDLAHAVGNVPLSLHDSGADFAVWCSYKYLNSGPGAVAGCFVHERWADTDRPRFAGWWGHDAATRFRMGPDFVPMDGADGWQLSNPPILALAPVAASLEIFDEVGMTALARKSARLTGYLEALLKQRLGRQLDVVTPATRGCQLSLRLHRPRDAARRVFDRLTEAGVVADWREPDVVRLAPVPLYNRFEDAWRAVGALTEAMEAA